ncbi:MAG: hypothetical protein ACC633_05210 [Anaerolineales bacterium]
MIKKEEFLDRLVDQAVKEYPLDPVPPGLYEKVVIRVERQILKPGLKFSWVDFSLSALLAGFIGIFLELIQSFYRSPYWSAWMRVEILLFWREIKMFFLHNQNILLVGLISIITVVSLLSILTGVYRRQLIFREQAAA